MNKYGINNNYVHIINGQVQIFSTENAFCS